MNAPTTPQQWARSSLWISGLTVACAGGLVGLFLAWPGKGELLGFGCTAVLGGGLLAVVTGVVAAVSERRGAPLAVAVVALLAATASAGVVWVFTHAGGM